MPPLLHRSLLRSIATTSAPLCTCRSISLALVPRRRQPQLSTQPIQPLHRRQIFSFLKSKDDKVPEPGFPAIPRQWYRTPEDPNKPKPLTPPPAVLTRDNLFHPLSQSPVPSMRAMGKRISRNSVCPVPVRHEIGHHHVTFECSDCGIPVYCSEDHYQADYHNHILICDTLREINEDEHDLRSGRDFPEFEYPFDSWEEAVINMTNWDTFLYTRQFEAINSERSLRQATKLLTYPVTIGSVLHELSPYNLRNNRLTPEGLKSFSASRYSLHPAPSGSGMSIKELKFEPPPMRFFILGARAESSLPREVWAQLAFMFGRATFHLLFIGPETFLQRPTTLPGPIPPRTPENPFGQLFERPTPRMKISTFTDYYHTIHKTGYFRPYDPYFDVFVLFHPGLGHPGSSAEWEEDLPMLLETKCPIIVTGFTEEDMRRDVEWVEEKCKGEFDILLEPGENIFKSLRWDLNEADPSGDLSQANYGVWAFRGKRYETAKAGESTVINL